MKRVVTPELLDTDSGTPAEVAACLRDLRTVNRWFGGLATTESMLVQVAREIGMSSISLLEVAAGSGYVPEVCRRRLQNMGVRLEVTLLDWLPSHLGSGSRAVVGNALALPFSDGSFDLVSCDLFAHHLAPRQLQEFVNESLRVGRKAVLINDLVRHPAHLLLTYAGFVLYRSRLTRHDAPASVRQAYTPQEICALLARTNAAQVEIRRHFMFRMGVIAWKHRPGA